MLFLWDECFRRSLRMSLIAVLPISRMVTNDEEIGKNNWLWANRQQCFFFVCPRERLSVAKIGVDEEDGFLLTVEIFVGWWRKPPPKNLLSLIQSMRGIRFMRRVPKSQRDCQRDYFEDFWPCKIIDFGPKYLFQNEILLKLGVRGRNDKFSL